MKSAQHEETGRIINLEDDEPIPHRHYEVPNCAHGKLSEPSRVLGSDGPLERHCTWCGTRMHCMSDVLTEEGKEKAQHEYENTRAERCPKCDSAPNEDVRLSDPPQLQCSACYHYW